MIFSDRHRFVFIHIPKCAGTSVRVAVMPYHDADKRFIRTVERHPRFGELDFRHLPLHLLREVDPEAFEKLTVYESYALIRDPFERFRSAMAQRAKMYLECELAQMSEDRLRSELQIVQDYLRQEPDVIAPEFIHFARQSDFVQIGDEVLVRNLFPVERLDDLAAALAQRIGLKFLPVGHANKTQVFRHPQLKNLARAGSAAARRMLPDPVHDAVRRSARRLLMKPIVTAPQPIFDSVQVRDFVADHYSADVALHQKVRQRIRQSA